MHLEEISNYPAVSIPKFSTVHDAFFVNVAAYFINLGMGFEVRYLVGDQMWQVEIKVGSKILSVRNMSCLMLVRLRQFLHYKKLRKIEQLEI